MASLQPKRAASPEELGDVEKGLAVFNPSAKKIEVVVKKPMPSAKEEAANRMFKSDPTQKYGVIVGRGKKSQRKKRANKKTQKRRGRK